MHWALALKGVARVITLCGVFDVRNMPTWTADWSLVTCDACKIAGVEKALEEPLTWKEAGEAMGKMAKAHYGKVDQAAASLLGKAFK